MEDFEQWLNDLDLQTLTDELKSEILERVQVVYEDAYGEGYHEAKHNMFNALEDM